MSKTGVKAVLSYIWAVTVLVSTLFAVFNGTAGAYTSIVSEGLDSAVELCISLAGIMAFWGGFMEIAERAGLCDIFARLLSPIVNLIFPGLSRDKEAEKAVSMNITANILGLGNAATPLGIEAMKRLHAADGCFDTASDRMVTFVIINTASVQIIPVTTAALRAKYGSEAPMSILPAVLLASLMSLIVGLIVDKMLRGLRRAAK